MHVSVKGGFAYEKQGNILHRIDDSLSEEDSKTTALSTSQINKTNPGDGSCSSIPRKTKSAKRAARQTQLKR